MILSSPLNGRALLGGGASEYGNATEGYSMTGVRCSGSELDVTDCPHSDDVTGCDVTESAAVSCLPDTPTPPPRTINTVYFTSLCVISLCTYSLFETSCKPKPGCSPTGYPPRRLLIIVECQLTGLLPSSAALALLVYAAIYRMPHEPKSVNGRRR